MIKECGNSEKYRIPVVLGNGGMEGQAKCWSVCLSVYVVVNR